MHLKGNYMSQAIANIRIPQKPGRPKKVQTGHTTGTGEIEDSMMSNTKPATLAYCPMPCRLLDLEAAAVYLGVSSWTVRDLEAAGVLRRVRVPLPDGKELRKLLFDKTDLDRLIEVWKDSAE
jgi:hypothetical protein